MEGVGPVCGDVAWGGNWFFLVDAQGRRISLQDVEALTDFTWRVRQALNFGLDVQRVIDAPTISGRAHVTAETTLLLDDADPFCWGIR